MKFAVSYSCGKDSAHALYKMIKAGHEPVCMIITVNEEAGRSWFHGVGDGLMEKVSRSLGIPLIAARCRGEDYREVFERSLTRARELGAQCCVFGDISTDEHLEWNRARCAAAGLECVVPLWGMDHMPAVLEFLDAGFTATIKCVNRSYLGDEYLGKVLTRELIDGIAAAGADACGEYGEYHTFVSDGPIFASPVEISLGAIADLGSHAAIDIT